MATKTKATHLDRTGIPACRNGSHRINFKLTQVFDDVTCERCLAMIEAGKAEFAALSENDKEIVVAGGGAMAEQLVEATARDDVADDYTIAFVVCGKCGTRVAELGFAGHCDELHPGEKVRAWTQEQADAAAAVAIDGAVDTARFVGTYKGATYRAVQLADGNYAVPTLSIDGEEVDSVLTGERFKSLSNAGHAVAAFVLGRLGLENKTPPARATFKLVSGKVAERVKATSTKGSKRAALRIFKRSPVNHVPAGSSRWFCSACMASFVVEGDSEPERCDNGHTAADFAEATA